MIAWLAVLLGCAPDIHAAFEADRAAAERVLTGSAPAGWEPSLRLQVPLATLQPMVERATDAAIRGLEEGRLSPGLGIELRAAPDLRLRGLDLSMAPACATSQGGIAAGGAPVCLRLDAHVQGSVSVDALGVARSVPVSGTLVAQVALSVDDDVVVRMRPAGVERVSLTAGGQVARVDLSPFLEEAIARAFERKAPRITVADLREGFPLRAVRVTAASDGLEIGALSDADRVDAVDPGPFPPTGLRARVAPSMVLALARRAAFGAGPMAMDIVADPRALTLTGHDLTVDLRLWRLAGRGWWRDYRVSVDVAVRNARLAIRAQSATVVDASPRAGWADPVAALVQSQVLTALEDALTRSVSVGRNTSAAGLSIAARMTKLQGEGGAWVADAELVAHEARP